MFVTDVYMLSRKWLLSAMFMSPPSFSLLVIVGGCTGMENLAIQPTDPRIEVGTAALDEASWLSCWLGGSSTPLVFLVPSQVTSASVLSVSAPSEFDCCCSAADCGPSALVLQNNANSMLRYNYSILDWFKYPGLMTPLIVTNKPKYIIDRQQMHSGWVAPK